MIDPTFTLPTGTMAALQRRLVQIMALFAIGMTVIVIAVQSGTPSANEGLLFRIAFILLNVIVLLLASRNNVRTATVLLIAILTLGTVVTRFTEIAAYSEALALIALLAAAALGGRRVYAAASFAVFIALGLQLVGSIQQAGTLFETALIHDIVVFTALVVLSLTIRFFTVTVERRLADASRSANLLRVSAEVGQIASRLLNLDDLLDQSIELIRNRFNVYHAQVFLLNDARDQAVLVASTGEVGQQLLARKHQLAVGSQSVIGQVSAQGKSIIAAAGSPDTVHARNELLPNTRTELALPIMDGETIIGALDVQSTEADAFSEEDVRALEITANLLATAIRNARLFDQQAKTAVDNERLLVEAQSNLREIERLNQQITQVGWRQYLNQTRIDGVTLADDALTTEAEWTPELTQASETRQPVRATEGEREVVAVPIMLRGEVIGAVEVEPEQANDPALVDVLQDVANRLALSLDNARLFEQSQGIAFRERKASEVANRLIGATDVRSVLNLAAEGLNDAMGAIYTRVHLQPDVTMEPLSKRTSGQALEPTTPSRGETAP